MEQRQYVGIDLHRRRSVIVRRTPEGETLDTVRIDNDALALAAELAKAGEHPEVVLEATYGWYWAADVLAECGASVHLAHPLGNDWGHRRVKNDERDATDLVDLLRMGRLAEAWIAPPPLRELREHIRYRAKLVHLRTGLKAQVHSVLAKEGVKVPMSDLFGLAGQRLLDTTPFADAYGTRVSSLRVLIEAVDNEIDMLGGVIGTWLADDVGYHAIGGHWRGRPCPRRRVRCRDRRRDPVQDRPSPGVVGRPDTVAPRVRHHGAPRPHHEAGLTAGALGGGRGRGPPARRHRAARPPASGGRPAGQEHRAGGGRPQARHPRLLRPARRRGPLPGQGRGVTPGPDAARRELAICHGPRKAARPPF